MKFAPRTLTLVALLGALIVPALGNDDSSPSAVDSPAFRLLDDLPLLPEVGTLVQFSSRNRKGENGDSGWHLYEDDQGDKVILDVEGPGCVRSMWGTNLHESSIFNVYFDGEEEPRYRIPVIAFYQGMHPLFPAPLNSYERRGRWGKRPLAGNAFVPIPFAEGLRISVSGRLDFYHILCECLPLGTGVETFTGEEDRSALVAAYALSKAGPGTTDDRGPLTEHDAEALEAGKMTELIRLDRPGCIRELVVEGPSTEAFLRDVWLVAHFDGTPLPQVKAPLGIFFGSAVRPRNLETLPFRMELLENDRVRMTCRFVMPFWEGAAICLLNRGGEASGPVRIAARTGGVAYPRARSGYFTACYREGRTTYGRDWLFMETPGAGRFLGAIQSMLGEHYCEGDEHIYLDGAISPQIHGTGSEDYYLGCFWPNREFNSPFANCVGDVQEEGGGEFHDAYTVPSCYSRYHLEAPVPFYRHLDARIQHGGFNHIYSNYRSLAFAYVRPRPAMRLTDFLDVGGSASEAAHGYRATESKRTGPITARPEGQYLLHQRTETGRIHEGGEIRFSLAVDPANRGVRIRRRLDQTHGRQTADVFVNGELAGTWYHADRNPHLRWYDSDLDLHPRFTAGKERLDILLKVRRDGGRGRFTDFRYEVFCLD